MDNQTFDASVLVLKILSCVYRVKEKAGASLIAEILTGSQNKKLMQAGYDKLSTYKIVTDLSCSQVEVVTKYLLFLGLLKRNATYQTLELTNKGKSFLKEKGELLLPQSLLEIKKEDLFPEKLSSTDLISLKLWNDGKTVSEIADIRKLKVTTILEHLANCVYHGKIVDISPFVSPELEKQISDAISTHKDAKLKELKENLPEEVSYSQIKFVLAINTVLQT